MQGLLLKIKYNGTRKHIFLVLFYNSFNVYSKVGPNLRYLWKHIKSYYMCWNFNNDDQTFTCKEVLYESAPRGLWSI